MASMRSGPCRIWRKWRSSAAGSAHTRQRRSIAVNQHHMRGATRLTATVQQASRCRRRSYHCRCRLARFARRPLSSTSTCSIGGELTVATAVYTESAICLQQFRTTIVNSSPWMRSRSRLCGLAGCDGVEL